VTKIDRTGLHAMEPFPVFLILFNTVVREDYESLYCIHSDACKCRRPWHCIWLFDH